MNSSQNKWGKITTNFFNWTGLQRTKISKLRSSHYASLRSNSSSFCFLLSSYRRLALLYHPTKNRDDYRAARQFHDIAEAYDVLSHRMYSERFRFSVNRSTFISIRSRSETSDLRSVWWTRLDTRSPSRSADADEFLETSKAVYFQDQIANGVLAMYFMVIPNGCTENSLAMRIRLQVGFNWSIVLLLEDSL